jgi:hypothetical protein
MAQFRKRQSDAFRKAKYIIKPWHDQFGRGGQKQHKDLVISECLRIQTLEGNQGVKKAAL